MLECLRFFNKTMNMKRDVGCGETGSDEAPRLRYFHMSHVSHVRRGALRTYCLDVRWSEHRAQKCSS